MFKQIPFNREPAGSTPLRKLGRVLFAFLTGVVFYTRTRANALRARSRTSGAVMIIAVIAAVSLFGAGLLRPAKVNATPANTINFQARLETAAGAIANDGVYNVEFKLYSASSGGTALWTEDYLVSASSGITTANGYLTANLGSITAFPNTINWGQQLYLTMNIGGTGTSASWDGEMNPRLSLTSVPSAFALNSYNSALGYTGSLTVAQPTGGSQTFTVPDQGAAGSYTLLTTNTANTNFIQNQNASAQATSNFWISGTGKAATSLQSPSFDTPSATTLSIGTSTATAITIGRSGITTTVAGPLTSTGLLTASSGLTVSSGSQFTNASSTLLSAIAISTSNTSIGTAAATVDIATTLNITETSTGQTLTIPSPTNSAAGRLIYVSNVGTNSFQIGTTTLSSHTSTTLLWDGTTWTSASVFGGINSYILNGTSVQASSNFNIDGNGVIGGTLKVSGVSTFAKGSTSAPGVNVGPTAAVGLTTGQSGTSADDALRAVANNLGAGLQVQNLNSSGYSGIEYINSGGSVGVFSGLNNSNNQEFRFNNILSGGYINFMIGGSTKLQVQNSGDISVTNNLVAGGNLQGTNVDGTTGINTGASGGTQRIDASGNLVNIGNITASGTYNGNTFTNNTLTFSGASATNISTASGQTLTVTGDSTSFFRSNAVAYLIGASGAVVQSTNGTATSGVNIVTGNASAGASGNITVDNGTFTSGTPAINIGNTNARSITIGNTTAATAVSIQGGTTGGLTLGGTSTPLTINSTNFKVTSGGAVSGVTTLGASGTITGVGVNAGTGLLQGTGGLTIGGTTTLSNLSTAGIVTNTAAGVLGTVSTIGVGNGGTGVSAITQYGIPYGNGSSALNVLAPGTAGYCLTTNSTTSAPTWAACSNGITGVGTYSTTNTAANAATISGNNIIFQSASASAPGMIDTGAQTLAGAKTFNALTTLSGGLTATGTTGINTSGTAATTIGSATTNTTVTLQNNSASSLVLSTTGTSITGTLGVSGAATLSSTLSVGSTSTFTGLITANGGVSTAALTASGVTNLNNNVTVTGSTTLSALTTAGIVTNTATGLLGTVASIPVGNGGTGLTTATQYGILYGNGTSALGVLAPGTAGYCLTTNSTTSAPTWAACTNGVTGIGTYSTTNNAANGAVITGNNIIFQSASASAPGMIDTGAQTFAGVKTFGAGLTSTGTTNINTSGTGVTTIGSATTNTTVTLQNNSASSLALSTTGTTITGTLGVSSTIQGTTLNGTTGINTGASGGTQRIDSNGNLVNITSITNGGNYNGNTFTSSALTFSGAVATSIASANGQNLTVDSGTTGQLNLGTAASAKTIQIGTTTGAVAQIINIGNNATASSTTTLTLGSTVGTSGTIIKAGSSGISLTGAVSASAGINAVTGYSFNGTPGANTTCGAGTTLSASVVQGGIVTGGTCTAYAAATGAAGYIQNQNAAAQATSTFWISGSGRSDTAFIAPAIRPAADSTNAFQIQNASGTAIMTFDTTNSRVTITGTANTSTAASAATFTLDNAATSTQNVIALNVAGTNRAKIRTDSIGNFVAEGTGSGTVYLNYGAGTGGLIVGNGSNVATATISGTGQATFQNSADSSSAFQLQTAAGANVIQVSTNTTNTNQVTNPSFESAAIGTGGWTARTGTTLSRTTTAANVYYGQAAGQAVVGTGSTNAGVNYAAQLAPSTTYGIHAMLKMTVNGTVSFGYAADGSTETAYVNTAAYGAVAATGWFPIDLIFTTPSTVASNAYIFIKQNDTSTRTMYIDGLRAESGGAGSYYQENQITLGNSATPVVIGTSPSNYPTLANASLYVQQAATGIGLTVRGAEQNNLNNANAFQVLSGFNGLALLAVSQPIQSTIITGGTTLYASAALQVVSNQAGGTAIRAIAASSQSADILQVQANGGSNLFSVGGTGNITATGTYNTNTFTSTALTFGGAATATITAASGQSLLVIGQAASIFGTYAGIAYLQGAGGSGVVSTGGTTSSQVFLQSGNATAGTSGQISVDNGTFTSGTPLIYIGANNARAIQIGNTTGATTLSLQAGTGGIGLVGNTNIIGNLGVTGTVAANTAIISPTTDAANVFEVQNAIDANVLGVDTTSVDYEVNGGAENNATFATNWTAYGTATIARTTTAGQYLSGTAATSVTTVAGAGRGVKNNLGAALTVGSTYLVSFSVKASTAGPFTDLAGVYLYNGTASDTGTNTCTAANTPSIGLTWVKVNCSITVGTAGTTAAAFAIYGSAAKTVYIDNFSITKQMTDGTLTVQQVRIGGLAGQGLTLLTVDTAGAPPTDNTTINAALYGSIYYDTSLGSLQCYGTSGWGACGVSPNIGVNLIPEYSGAVLDGTKWGSNKIGTMTSGLCSGSSRLSINTSLCGATDDYNYYAWTSPQATSQTYSIYVRYQLPATFKSFTSTAYPTLSGYSTNVASSATGSAKYGGVDFSMFDKNGNSCGATGSPSHGANVTAVTTTASTWQTGTLDPTASGLCSFTAGDTITFRIDVTSINNSNAYASNLSFLTIGK